MTPCFASNTAWKCQAYFYLIIKKKPPHPGHGRSMSRFSLATSHPWHLLCARASHSSHSLPSCTVHGPILLFTDMAKAYGLTGQLVTHLEPHSPPLCPAPYLYPPSDTPQLVVHIFLVFSLPDCGCFGLLDVLKIPPPR